VSKFLYPRFPAAPCDWSQTVTAISLNSMALIGYILCFASSTFSIGRRFFF